METLDAEFPKQCQDMAKAGKDGQKLRRGLIRTIHYTYLRAAACKNRELHFSDHLVEFLIFRLKIPLD